MSATALGQKRADGAFLSLADELILQPILSAHVVRYSAIMEEPHEVARGARRVISATIGKGRAKRCG